ncbi:MAG TPA: FtsQ-type POTRA domain-containing protein [Blastocatellia bacterium]|nr:FtsQ-type POTRA domain-containing protein [Blastocatellia bacterium]
MALAPKSDPRVRNQVVTPRSSRRLDKSRSRRRSAIDVGKIFRTAVLFARPVGVLVAIVLVILGYNALANSRLFLLHRVIVSDASPPLGTDIEHMIRKAVGQTGLMDVDLSTLRQKVEAIPRVRAASIARVLPDGIFVRLTERQPAVLVRRESEALVWLDEDGVEMGEFSDVKPPKTNAKAGEPEEIPPIAKGFAEGNRSQAAITEDRERIALFKQIEREFSDGPNPLWGLVDQIDLTFTKDVNIRLARPPVLIHVGSTDFRKRFERALQVLYAIKQGDSELPSRFRVQDIDRLIQNASNINFIDAARSERIVVNFATPGAKAVRQEPILDRAPKKK